ncbi:MAG: site-specific integrase [Allorhizobium sp.]
MGTITARKRKDNSTGYTAQIVRKKDGKILLREAKTFSNKREATAWIAYREAELDKPGGIERATRSTTTLADAIDAYTARVTDIGRTKTQCLRSIKEYRIAQMACEAITAKDISDFAHELRQGGRKPQTVNNYLSHMSAVFRVARPLFGMQLSVQEMQDAQMALAKSNDIAKSAERDRRPTLDELDMLMQHFVDRQKRAPHSAPMHKIIPFAIFSTRRQEEITRIRWEDLDQKYGRILVRDMKHPGQKKGNDVLCELPPEAMRIALSMPPTKPQIFPYTTDAISAAFTRACAFLGIEDLHFHDLRHEGVSRLFEMGRTIPLAASVSGHRSWSSLKRYTKIMGEGDKFAGWKWMEAACE